ncbi:hypothetical protein MTR67_052901 [Solanum verrucosum]|uniref:Reverse transcriptase RNase H-like domain-containing protein n=1 Tax=Solanum verrucosum TaxID=315347 RepID=A0AAF0VA06_SOLVR|nr:hypothetical protein MTR67_052901 [Solanum verrucosum]
MQGFAVYCGASRVGLGCVLMQNGKVITYASRQLKVHEKKLSNPRSSVGCRSICFENMGSLSS